MIERIADMPDGTIGFRVAGEVTKDDYDSVLVPDLRAAVESGRGLRALYVIEHFDEIQPGALWEDTKLGADLAIRHREAFVRSAIATDIEWMAKASRLFSWMIPGETRVFGLAEVEQAKAWVAGSAG